MADETTTTEVTEVLLCDKCTHKNVCKLKDIFKQTNTTTKHEYIKLTVSCSEFLSQASILNG